MIFAEDEAIISFNPNSRKLWAPKGSKPILFVNGSHQNVCFFGAVSDKKRHCCTAKWINEDSFIKFLKYLLKMYGKIVVIADRATHHFKSLKVKNFIKELKGKIILWPLPKRLPELNPMEPGWKSARKNVTYKLFDNKKTLGWAVKSHIRWEFKINLTKFWS
jgi:transposase